MSKEHILCILFALQIQGVEIQEAAIGDSIVAVLVWRYLSAVVVVNNETAGH